MTSEAKIRANRRNALQSTGPKTAHGKAQSRQNSRKHGLAVPLGIDDVEVQELTDVMAELERMFGEVREMIRSAAKDQCEVTRVQRARADMLNEQIGKMLHSEAEPVTAEEQIATAMAAIVPDLEALDPRNVISDPDGDVDALARALHGFATRIEEFVERERNFTRDASHELRSPLTVIKVAGDVLAEEEMDAFPRRAVDRIRRSVRDMEATIEAFLILARESDMGLPEEDFVANEAVREEIERAQPLIEGKPVHLVLDEQATFQLHAPPKVFASMVGNLIRNACLYTEAGNVDVQIGTNFVRVRDSGIGMSEEELRHIFKPYYRGGAGTQGGYGVGLSLVQRLSDRFGWPVEMNSQLKVGTTATIRFPQARPFPDDSI